MFAKYFMFGYIIHFAHSEWEAEWMTPIKDQFDNIARRTNNGPGSKTFNDEDLRMIPVLEESNENPTSKSDFIMRANDNDVINSNLKIKLENTLENAKILADTLHHQIITITSIENTLKDAIVNGRSGTTAVTVTTIGQPPRSYIIRDNYWILCDGLIQHPTASAPTNLFNERLSTPRCIGQEIASRRDPCAFSSVIKYETIPTQRRLEYTEDDYLCLKTTFNNTLEQYMSVPKSLINAACINGVIRSLADNIMECGLRVMADYTFYPHRSSSSELPLEYCVEKDGTCKLIIAWHISNTTVENFEFLKNEQNFKKFFIKSGSYIEHL